MLRPKIESIETFLVDRWCIVRLVCDDGSVGYGEAGVHAWPAVAAAAIKSMSSYLIGKDASLIEHHAQFLQRSMHFSGAVLAGAISAIDIALWDAKARRFGAPIYELMGGRTRDKVRCYIHVNGETTEQLVADAISKTKMGFTAIRFSPFSTNFHQHSTFDRWAREAFERVSAVHDAVGKDADLCIELHRQMSPAESVALAHRIQPLNPYFYEDPMRPDSPALMGEIQRRINVPIATGERFSSVYQFQQLLASGGCDYIRPDLCLCLGLTGSKKVAGLAEAYHVKVIPHNPLSPISTAACVQLDAAIPNFALQEYIDDTDESKKDLMIDALILQNGHLLVPDKPGLGIEINDASLRQLAATAMVPNALIGEDGSVHDW